jgi:glycosyltransferase involved in cell wall biosynthesis
MPDPTRGSGRVRVVVVTNIPAPYRVELFGYLAELVDLHVVFRHGRESNRRWDAAGGLPFASTTLHLGERGPGRSFHPREAAAVARTVQALHPQVVVVGGYDAPLVLAGAVRGARRVGARVVLWSGSHEHSLRSRSPVLPALRRAAFRSVDGVIAYSSRSAAFARRCGATDVHVLGNAHRRLPAPGLPSRKERPLGDYLYVGQFSARKQFDLVLDWTVSHQRSLVAVGDGPLAERARRTARVTVCGHLDGADLQRAYASASALVFPSPTDPWGLVVNEAMEAGTPVICDARSGCVPDLADDGRTAIVRTIDQAGDLEAAVCTLERERSAPALVANARQAVQGYRCEQTAPRLANLLESWSVPCT